MTRMNADRDSRKIFAYLRLFPLIPAYLRLEPVWKLRGALRRGILAVAKAALAARSAPQRAVRNEPTPATAKRPATRRVFAEKAVCIRPARECLRSCSVVAARSASFVAPRHPAFSPKTAPLVVSKPALSPAWRRWSSPPLLLMLLWLLFWFAPGAFAQSD